MTAQRALFVGGPWDGRVELVDFGRTLAVIVPMSPQVALGLADSRYDVLDQQTLYRPVKFGFKSDAWMAYLPIMVHAGMTDAWATRTTAERFAVTLGIDLVVS